MKTGRVQHEVFRKKTVKLIGDDPVYLWTKNALERNGFEVGTTGDVEVVIDANEWGCKREEVPAAGTALA
ncbi:MAG: hypothetical protein WDO15_19510 [Bacteroidota bacterium]